MNKRTLAIASLIAFAFASTAVAQDQSQQPSPAEADGPAGPAAILPARRLHHGDRPARADQPPGRHGAGDPPGPHRQVDRALGHRAPGRERRRLHERMDARPDLDQHPRRRDRGPGPRLQEPGAGADQRPSRRHRQHLQAVDRRHRAHRDRARALLGDLRQPEHGRRHQHHPEDRPDRAGQRRAGRCGLVEPARRPRPRPAALYSGLRLVCRRSPASTRDNYAISGGAPEHNTAWTRYGGNRRLRLPDRRDQPRRGHGAHRTASTMPASAARAPTCSPSTRATTIRSTRATSARRATGRATVYFQAYFVTDVDDLNNPSPLSALNASASRTTTDHNRRQLDILGTRFQPRYKLFAGNELLVGLDWERSWLRSDRYRLGGAAVTQLSPQDNNQTDNVFAFYARGFAELLRRQADRARRRAPDLGHHGARLDAAMRRPWSPAPTPTRRRPTRRARPTPSPTGWPAAPAPRAAFARRPPPSSAPTSRSRRSAPRSSAIRAWGRRRSQQWRGRRDGNVEGRPLRHGGVPEHHLQPHRAAHRVLDRRRVVQVQTNSPANLVVQGIEFQMRGRPVPVVQLAAGRRRPGSGTCSATATTTSR